MTNITKFQAVLFDMDGTLVDTEPVGGETMRSFLEKHQIVLDDGDWVLFDKVWRRDGTDVTFEDFLAGVFKKYVDQTNADKEIAEFYHDYENNILLAKQLPGATDALSYLKNKYKLALVTASTKPQAMLVLKHNGWEGVFDLIVSHDDFTKSKPDPESFLTAAGKLGVPADACVVVEDSKNGSLAGKNAGMTVIGVRAGNRHPQDLTAANTIIETLNGLEEIL